MIPKPFLFQDSKIYAQVITGTYRPRLDIRMDEEIFDQVIISFSVED